MKIWLEKFLLAVLVMLLGTTVIMNLMNLDLTQRLSLAVAIIAMSIFVAYSIEKRSRVPTDMTDPNAKRVFSGGTQSTSGISQAQQEEGSSSTSHMATPAAATRSTSSDNFMESGVGPTAQPEIAIEPPLAIDVSSGYSSPASAARIAFDYSNNDGRFTIGHGEMTFITAWSKASNTSIHAYKDASGMQSVSLASGLKEIDSIEDASSFDASSRVRTAQLGEIVIWRNARGYYAATKVERIKDRTRGDDKDELVFTYRIQTNGTTSFRSR